MPQPPTPRATREAVDVIERTDDSGPTQAIYGYVRAVRVSDRIFVSGTTGSGPDGDAIAADLPSQITEAWQRITAAVTGLTDDGEHCCAVRTRAYVAGPAPGDVGARLADHMAGTDAGALTITGVTELVGAGHLVELETEWAVAP